MARPGFAAASLAVLAVAGAAAPAPAAAVSAGEYELCDAALGTRVVQVARATCAEAAPAAIALGLASAGNEQAALTATGWTAVRAATAISGTNDVIALRGRAVLRVRRDGATPDLDGWAAGRELVFSRGRLQGGKPVPRDASLCTSAFLIRLRGRPAGLSAGHCAGLTRSNTAQRRNVALRRVPQPGIVLGRVLRLLNRTAPLDALAVSVPSGTGRTRAAIVDREITRPPWIVAGVAKPTRGRAVCFTGRTSGVDRCGQIAGSGARGIERLLTLQTGVVVRCTTIDGIPGDSGGPVYTAARQDGTVRAIGIVSLGVGRSGRVCFTPIAPVLDRLGATLVTG
jgi:hypothetical protein